MGKMARTSFPSNNELTADSFKMILSTFSLQTRRTTLKLLSSIYRTNKTTMFFYQKNEQERMTCD